MKKSTVQGIIAFVAQAWPCAILCTFFPGSVAKIGLLYLLVSPYMAFVAYKVAESEREMDDMLVARQRQEGGGNPP